jgi:hypothetical protein
VNLGALPCDREPPRSRDARLCAANSGYSSAIGSRKRGKPKDWRSRIWSDRAICFHSASTEAARRDKGRRRARRRIETRPCEITRCARHGRVAAEGRTASIRHSRKPRCPRFCNIRRRRPRRSFRLREWRGRARRSPSLPLAVIARLSGSVSDIWLSPARSSCASITSHRARFSKRFDFLRQILGARAVRSRFRDIAFVQAARDSPSGARRPP